MKRTLSNLVTALLAAISFSPALYAEPVTFTLDNNHTYVFWKIKHLGFSTQAGKWYANGQLILDKDHPDQSKVNATIKIADIVTGLPELDKHLKSKLFFDNDKFPKATFVSDKVEVVSDKSAKVHGMLNLRGVSKPVTLDVTFNKVGINPITNKNTVGFSATATLKRSDFGMTALLPALGDEVVLQIDAEAYQNKK
jgi:polyisoprenoid-binding protein YceI